MATMHPGHHHDPQHDTSKSMLGFWIYLMTDCVLFATLFATYLVLRGGTFGGPDGKELFSLPFVLAETIILLTSSFTSGLALLAARRAENRAVLAWMGATIVLGLAFLGLELSEFAKLAAEGNSWTRSAFLSSFFTLVGTHGLHITAGLLWAFSLIPRLVSRPLDHVSQRRVALWSLFWHFLDVVWIFIFTIVYLFGVAL